MKSPLELYGRKKESHELNESFNFKELEKLQKEMNEDIHGSFETVEERDIAVDKIQRVFEHSVNDGLRLGQQYGLTPSEWARVLISDEVTLKHPKLIKEIAENTKKLINTYSSSDLSKKFVKTAEHNLESVENGDLARHVAGKRKLVEHTAIDDYYAEILSQSERELRPQKFHPSEDLVGTKNERNAKEYLTQLRPFLQGQYYKGEILPLVYKYLDEPERNNIAQTLYKRAKSTIPFEEFLQGLATNKNLQEEMSMQYITTHLDDEAFGEIYDRSILSSSTITKLEKILPAEIKDSFEKARHQKLDVTYNIKRQNIEKPLLKEVQERVKREKGKDFGVELNAETNQYEIIDERANERKINNRDQIETAKFAQAINSFSEFLKGQEGSDFDPREINSFINKYSEKYTEIFNNPEISDSEEYIGARSELIPKKEFLELIGETFDESPFMFVLDINAEDIVREGHADFVIERLEALKSVNKVYVEEIIEEVKEYEKEYKKEHPEKNLIQEKEIYNLEGGKYIVSRAIINGELAFAAKLENGKYAVIKNGEQIGREYKDIYYLTNINGELAFAAKLENGKDAVIKNGEQIGREYKDIYSLTNINGELAFRAELENGKDAVIKNGEQIGREYEKILTFGEHEGNLQIFVQEGKNIKEILIPLDAETPELDSHLTLLNTIHNPDLEQINNILGDAEPKKMSILEEMKQEISSSWDAAKNFSKMIRNIPKEFLSLNRVKKTRAERQVADQLQRIILSEVYAKKEQQEKESRTSSFNSWTRGSEHRSESLALQPADYLNSNQESIGYQGGNPNEQIGKEEIALSSRLPLVQKYVSRGYYANEQNGRWNKSYIPLDTEPSGFSRENTLTTASTPEGKMVYLPIPTHSSYIPERVKAITSQGEEISVAMEIDSFGQGKVLMPQGAERIMYSIQESMIQETPVELDELEFEKVKKNIMKQELGKDYFEKISGINEQDKLFVKSLEALSPKEKIKAIEKYVQDIGYYDFDNNDEVVGPKRNANSEELFYLMEERMNELRANFPEKDYGVKRYAGVCDDYSKLTTALLREAGIPSGLMTCFMADSGKNITLGQAHATAFALWRGPNGNITPYTVDGTPAGMTAQERELQVAMGINPETIEEKEQSNEKILEEIREHAEAEMKEVEELLKNLTTESIRELSNGKLENALNMILTYDVNWNHVRALESVLMAYRYTPLYKNIDSSGDTSVAKNFLSQQMNQIKTPGEYSSEHSGSAGSALFGLVKEFIAKESKQGSKGLEDFKKITELIEASLTKNEHRSLVVITQYLEAKKMLS